MWTEAIIILREFIGDPTGTTYTDASLQRILAISAFRVRSEVAFENDYTVDLTPGSETVSPDFSSPLDYDFINLICLRAVISIIGAELKLSTNDITSIKDGPATITLGKSNVLKDKLADSKFQYDEYVKNYLCGKSKYSGAVIGPYGKIQTDNSYYDDRQYL